MSPSNKSYGKYGNIKKKNTKQTYSVGVDAFHFVCFCVWGAFLQFSLKYIYIIFILFTTVAEYHSVHT